MAGKTKPKCTRRVWDRLNPITVALNAATLLNTSERQQVMAPLTSAMDALRRGQSTERQWLHLATCAQLGMCIDDQRIVTGLRDHFKAADLALCHINERAMTTGTWRAPTCYGHELATLETMITLYEFQISKLAAGEYRRAIALAKARQLTHGGKVVKDGVTS
ncbi:MAG: hypothetical protein K0M67_16340 [Thiobacillus sp.]|nr:hypothetical protein [Thiobacillus sp.]